MNDKTNWSRITSHASGSGKDHDGQSVSLFYNSFLSSGNYQPTQPVWNLLKRWWPWMQTIECRGSSWNWLVDSHAIVLIAEGVGSAIHLEPATGLRSEIFSQRFVHRALLHKTLKIHCWRFVTKNILLCGHSHKLFVDVHFSLPFKLPGIYFPALLKNWCYLV